MRRLELLAPAKNLECGKAAIDHGADAVYIGAERFGARAAAGNSVEDIKTLCEYAHRFDAKVYVTVNTIIYDEEMGDTVALVKELKDIGVDAILVQDMGLVRELRNLGTQELRNLGTQELRNLGMALHASTQTDNRTVEKVRWLASLGFKRVVLARELSIDEIRDIHKAVPDVELEVFVHGALCVSYSGQCYASQACFGRSANRGECAQFCRMQFDLVDGEGKIIKKNKHMLSLKDMAQIDNMEKLADAGAVSFKIEGRLKDVDYVKNITAAYSERLNDICRRKADQYCRASMGRCTYTFMPDIHKSFNRDFTTYFAEGRKPEQANLDTPKAKGQFVGKTKELRGSSFTVAGTASFANGDGLCFLNDKKELVGFRVNRAEGNRLFPLKMPEGLMPGTMLYRNHDQAFESLLSKPSSVRKVAVTMTLHITEAALELTMTDEHGNEYSSTLPYSYQKAQKPQEDNIRRQLTKLGDTVFVCDEVKIKAEVETPFIPSSQLAELRHSLRPHPLIPLFEGDGASSVKVDKKVEVPRYSQPYMYNAANEEAKAFYKERGVEAASFERDKEGESGTTIMQCRYCIRHELGFCSKYTDYLPWKEPLRLVLGDGREFRLRFNCGKCQMEVDGLTN